MDDGIMKQINEGFEKLREAMTAGFKEAAQSTSDINIKLGVIEERIEVVRDAQKTLKGEVDEMKKIEDDVSKNTDFREKRERREWAVLKIIIGVVTLSLIYLIASAIVQNGVGF